MVWADHQDKAQVYSLNWDLLYGTVFPIYVRCWDDFLMYWSASSKLALCGGFSLTAYHFWGTDSQTLAVWLAVD